MGLMKIVSKATGETVDTYDGEKFEFVWDGKDTILTDIRHICEQLINIIEEEDSEGDT